MPASPPRQERSRQTLDRLLDAATEVIEEKGQLNFTLPEVAQRAGIAVGTVYRRFSSKDQLVSAVLTRQRDHEDAVALLVWAGTDWTSRPIKDLTDQLVRDLAGIWRDREQFMRAIMLRHLIDGPDLSQTRGPERMVTSMEQFREAIGSCGRAVQHEDPDTACDFAYRMIIGMCARRTAVAIETQTPALSSWADLLDQLSDAVARYLFGSEYQHL